ncbi:MAG: hypothetical protein U0269_15295 [Polyangiales bacterium]
MRIRLTFSALALAFALTSLTSNAHAQATADQITTALSGVEQAPSAEQVRAWTDRSIPTLVSLAEDGQRAEFIRARAAAAIRTFAPSADARAALERLANGASPHPLVLRAALDGLCIGWGDFTIAQRFLSSLSSDHREAAAWAIARSGRPEARVILNRAKDNEQDPALRATFDSALRELERAITAGSRSASPTTTSASATRAPTDAMRSTTSAARPTRRARTRR